MRRHRRTWLRPAESPSLDRETSVGVTLPSFNFIEPKVPRRPVTTKPSVLPSIGPAKRNNNATPPTNGTSVLDCDTIVYHTLRQWAQDLDDPTLTDDSKMTRLWQSLQRHSEAGRFSDRTDYAPNAICSMVAMEILQQILEASGVSLMLTNLLIGAIGNSIFRGYVPEKSHRDMKQYADIARELREEMSSTTEELASCKEQAATHRSQLAAFQVDGRTEDRAQLVTAVYRSVEEQGLVPSLIMETLTPFFNDELLLLLWNAMAKASATQRLASDLDEGAAGSDDDDDNGPARSITTNRARASFLASRVLQERVRLMLLLWQTLSPEEKTTVSKGLVDDNSGVALKGVLQTLEEIYVSEQVRERSSSRRSMFLSPAARHSSVVVWQPQANSHGTRPDGMAFTRTPTRRRMMSTRVLASTPEQLPQASASPTTHHVSIPDVLLGALAEGQHNAATEESQLLIEQLSNEQDEILRECEEIFDLLCEDPAEHGVRKRANGNPPSGDVGANAIVDLAKERLCDLLCNYVDAPSFILEKMEKSDADRALRESVSRDLEGVNNTNAFVQTLIQRQRQDPAILVHAINQSPEILLSAITCNNGILRFAMTKFPPLVKRFLRLDLKACEYLDVLAQKNKGIQLLWGTNNSPVAAMAVPTPAPLSVSGVLEDVLTSRRRSSVVMDSRGPALTPSEGHLLEWFAAHTEDLALLSLKRPDILKPLFVEMHTVGDVGTFHRMMLQVASTKGVQNYIQRASVSTLEKIAQDDPAEVGKLLREIFGDSGNQDLLHQLQSSPYLTTCLAECHPTAMQDVMTSDMETWRHYFVETVSANDAMLREILATRTEMLDGGETLVKLFTAVVAGATAGLNLHVLDFGASPADVAMAKTRDGLSRRKMVQCIYLRGGSSVFSSVITQLIASASFHPHEQRVMTPALPLALSRSPPAHALPQATSSAVSSHGKPKKASHGAHVKKRRRSTAKKSDAGQDASTDAAAEGGESDAVTLPIETLPPMPPMWRSFVLHFVRHQQQQQHAPTLALAHAKMLILDVWIEFLKVDTVQLDNACLWSLAPFVCDYLVTRYDSPIVVGAWLYALVEALAAFPDDPRVAFFASSCGFGSNDGYDTFLYYAHALGHVLFGHMKVFKTECRLDETADGSCPVDRRFAIATAARLFDHRLLGGPEINDLMTRLELLPSIDTQGRIELDDAMGVFLDQWRLVNSHVDERYRQAFASHDVAKSNRIGLEQFIKIVTSVLPQAISPRECLLVFCDVGEELLDLDTLLRVTRVYHLRLFNSNLPEITLDESERQELAQSVGRTNIYSMTRELEDLHRFWKGLRVEVQDQIDALHQSKTTKMHLKKQSALIERLLHDLSQATPPQASRPQSQHQERSNTGPQTLQRAWTELRACAKMLQSAKLTQHYLSRLYIQTCVVRWIRVMRKRQRAREQHELEREQTDGADQPHPVESPAQEEPSRVD